MKRLALFVGINDYPNSPLSCARADAEVLFQEFRSRYDATSILTDREASPERIAHEIEKFQQILSPGDMFLFYFSGHGCEQGGDRVLAVPHYDVQGNYMEMFGFTIDILKRLTDVMGVHRLFVLDCCRTTIQSVDNVAASGKMAGYMARHGSKALIPPTILSSSAPGQCSYEHPSSGHGYFTEAFIAAIRSPQVRSFNVFRDRLDYEMQILHTPGAQDPYFEGGIGANLPFWPSWDNFYLRPEANSSTDGNNKNIVLGDVVDAFAGFSHSSFYIGGAIPEKKRRNAWNSMRVRGYDSSILALYDNTFWGGSSEGFVMTGDGFYAKNSSNEMPVHYRWQDIRNIRVDNNGLVINDSVVNVTYVDDAGRKALCDGMRKLVAAATGHEVAAEDADSHIPDSGFYFIIEDTFQVEGCGIVVAGCVRGENVSIGRETYIMRGSDKFCKARVVGIEHNNEKVNEGKVGESVGLLIRTNRRFEFSELSPGMMLVDCFPQSSGGGVYANWYEGMPHPTVPHIIAMATPDKWQCEAGYVLKNPEDPQAGCVWRPGKAHPCHAHVVAAEKEGKWTPERGYCWTNQNDKNDSGVRWTSGVRPVEHVYSSDQEGIWCCDDGYRFIDPNNPFEGVILDDVSETDTITGHRISTRRKKTDYPHVINNRQDGGLAPEPGYAWVNSSLANDFRVKWMPGHPHPDIPHIIASSKEGVWIPERGYEWDGPRKVRKK